MDEGRKVNKLIIEDFVPNLGVDTETQWYAVISCGVDVVTVTVQEVVRYA